MAPGRHGWAPTEKTQMNTPKKKESPKTPTPYRREDALEAYPEAEAFYVLTKDRTPIATHTRRDVEQGCSFEDDLYVPAPSYDEMVHVFITLGKLNEELMRANATVDKANAATYDEAEIIKWGKKTFPDANRDDMIAKLREEYHELMGAAHDVKVKGDGNGVYIRAVQDEIADVAIVLTRLSWEYGMSLGEAVQRKFQVVKARDYSSAEHGA